MSYRGAASGGEREADGRLFTPIPRGKLTLLLESAGLQVVHSLTQDDATGRPTRWHVLLAEKNPLLASRGLDRIQSILVQDRKVATYKFALIRALCELSRMEPHVVRWGEGMVYVPLWSLAVKWLAYYWPFITARGFIAQLQGEKPAGAYGLSFRRPVLALAERYGGDGLHRLLGDIEEEPERFVGPLRAIANAIRKGPVTHAGGAERADSIGLEAGRPFRFAVLPAAEADRAEGAFGWVEVPEPIWLDISRFDHWIEESTLVRWARLTAQVNVDSSPSDFLPLLLSEPGARRDTGEVEGLLAAFPSLECVWSGRSLAPPGLHLDHVVPHSVWGNSDLWNLLPCTPRLNLAKRDSLPTPGLLRRRRDCIIHYWRGYSAQRPRRFAAGVSRALGTDVTGSRWELRAFAGLQETVERLAAMRGLSRWEP